MSPLKSGFTCKCGCSVCFSPSFLSCQLPLKAIWTRPPNQPLPHDFLCYTINRSIYIAFHGWALSQYFRGPTVNWPLIIHCSLVHLILHIACILRYNVGFTKTRSVFLICNFWYFLSVPVTKVSFQCVSRVMLVTWARFKHVIPPCVQSGGQMTEARRSWRVTCDSLLWGKVFPLIRLQLDISRPIERQSHAPAGGPPWDLNSENICMVVNGERQIFFSILFVLC